MTIPRPIHLKKLIGCIYFDHAVGVFYFTPGRRQELGEFGGFVLKYSAREVRLILTDYKCL
jgi:hypothetical protein